MTPDEILRWESNNPVIARMTEDERKEYARLKSAAFHASQEAHSIFMAVVERK